MRDMYSNVVPAHLLKPQQISATTKSDYVDVSGYESAIFLVQIGDAANLDSGDYYTVTLQHSDSTADTGFATVTGTDIQGSFTVLNDTTSDDNKTYIVGYNGDKRYVRVVLTETADTDNGTVYVGVMALLGKGRHNDPTSSDTPTIGTAA